MASPIFLLGSARNGTTWLFNILCRHPQVVGAQHEAHWGMHESRLYRHMQYWGDLSDDRAFIRFLELYSSGDYFRLVEGEKDYFYRNRPQDFLSTFFTLMDRYVEKNNVTYWITKLDPHLFYREAELDEFIARARERYGQACKFVGIKRDLAQVLRSYIKMQGRASQRRSAPIVRQLATWLGTARYAVHYRMIECLLEDQGGLMVDFGELVQDREMVSRRMTEYLGIDYSSDLLHDEFRPNSSLAGITNLRSLSRPELFVAIRLLFPFFSKMLPISGVYTLKLRDWMKRQECPVYWRLLRLDFMPQAFERELLRTGDLGLRDLLFDVLPEKDDES